jgi:cell division protein FtsW (lipid II flippase)
MCLALMIGTFKPITKIVLGVFFFIFMLAMFASGTRSAFVMIPAGIAFFALITFKRWIVISAIGGFILLVIVVLMPTVNNAHFRVKTAFQPQTDDSYQVRAKNQKRIQPFIQQHPMGGGLGSVGVWGKKFTPYSMLANFPPDSGYMRVAVEAGWIGLALYLSMLFVAMKTGIQNYFRMKDPELRSYMLATLITFFVLILANFPQEAIIQLPTNVIFFIVMALLTKLKTLEEERTLETNVARQ